MGLTSGKSVQIPFTDAQTTLSDETLTTIATFDVSDTARIFVEIANTVTAFDQFAITARASANGGYQTLYSAAADYTSPQGLLIGTSGDLTTIAAGSSGWFVMDVSGLESVVIKAARAAGSNAVVTVYAGGN